MSNQRLLITGTPFRQLAVPKSPNYARPALLESITISGVKKISISQGYFANENLQHGAFLLTQTGQIYNWGPRRDWASVPNESRAVSTTTFHTFDGEISDISSGFNHHIAVTQDGKVFAWGDITKYEGEEDPMYFVLGRNSDDLHRRSPKIPVLVRFPPGVLIKQVACGCKFSIALSTEGKLFSWGVITSTGVHGRGPHAVSTATPLPLDHGNLNGVTFVQVSALPSASFNCAAVDSEGNLYTWGVGSQGQLGTGQRATSYHPTKLVFQAPPRERDPKFVQVSVGISHMAAITDDGRLFTFGNNIDGQLGIGLITKESPQPTKVDLKQKVAQVCCGDYFTVVRTMEGKIFSW